MASYNVTYHWDSSQRNPVLLVVITGNMLHTPDAIPLVIDQTHALIDAQDYSAVRLVYDISGVRVRLRLGDLMRRTMPSRKIERVAVVGARGRTDEMSILISSTAHRLPYEIAFFRQRSDALAYARADAGEDDPAPASSVQSAATSTATSKTALLPV